MARFGKKAALESQKSTKEVECIVSVAEDGFSVNPSTGDPLSYYVEAQRLQDGVSPEDAMAGLADSSPFITNKKEYYKTWNGEKREKTSHTEQISAYGMEQIRKAAVNEFVTIRKVFDSVTGEEKEKRIHNYIVKLNIGFGGPGKPAFFYVPKAVNLTEKDERYSFRNMPKPGRELTQDILDRHNEITRLAKQAAQELYSYSGTGNVVDEGSTPSTMEQMEESRKMAEADAAAEMAQEAAQEAAGDASGPQDGQDAIRDGEALAGLQEAAEEVPAEVDPAALANAWGGAADVEPPAAIEQADAEPAEDS